MYHVLHVLLSHGNAFLEVTAWSRVLCRVSLTPVATVRQVRLGMIWMPGESFNTF